MKEAHVYENGPNCKCSLGIVLKIERVVTIAAEREIDAVYGEIDDIQEIPRIGSPIGNTLDI
jgi:hypothetical protein